MQKENSWICPRCDIAEPWQMMNEDLDDDPQWMRNEERSSLWWTSISDEWRPRWWTTMNDEWIRPGWWTPMYVRRPRWWTMTNDGWKPGWWWSWRPRWWWTVTNDGWRSGWWLRVKPNWSSETWCDDMSARSILVIWMVQLPRARYFTWVWPAFHSIGVMTAEEIRNFRTVRIQRSAAAFVWSNTQHARTTFAYLSILQLGWKILLVITCGLKKFYWTDAVPGRQAIGHLVYDPGHVGPVQRNRGWEWRQLWDCHFFFARQGVVLLLLLLWCN
jgi:hypothetical protein